MNKQYYQWLVAVTALCAAANGLAYLFFPVSSLAILGLELDGFGVAITRYYGACAFGWGLLLWSVRRCSALRIKRMALVSILITLGFSTLVGAQALVAAVFNPWGWILVITDAGISVSALVILVLLCQRSER